MVKIIEDFTEQASEMLDTIERLERECNELQTKLTAGGGDNTELEALRQELSAARQELLALQADHNELEERYLELKVKTG